VKQNINPSQCILILGECSYPVSHLSTSQLDNTQSYCKIRSSYKDICLCPHTVDYYGLRSKKLDDLRDVSPRKTTLKTLLNPGLEDGAGSSSLRGITPDMVNPVDGFHPSPAELATLMVVWGGTT
jgi:hypothetical protein